MSQNRIVFVCGRKGKGKTTWAADLARKVYYAGGRVCVVAPMGGFDLPGAPVFRGECRDRYHSLQGRSWVVVPESDADASEALAFCWFSQDPEVNPQRLTVFVDEADLYYSQHQPDPYLQRIVRYGRNRCIDLVAISQRPANVHKDIIAAADVKVIFQTTLHTDIDYLVKWAGVDPDQVRALPDFTPLIIK